jgi:hypothetical protein
VALKSELNEFAYYVSSASKASMSRAIPPPLFHLMMKLKELKMVDQELTWHYEEGKPRDDFIKFGTNSDVTIGDFNPGTHEVHGFDEPGCKVDMEGKIYSPIVYYASKQGFIVSCHRRYLTHAEVYKHFLNGTGNILGKILITSPSFAVYYVYFVRNYKVMSNFSTFFQRRVFHGSSVQMEGGVVPLNLGSVILATLVSRRKKGYVVQHEGATWNNLLDLIRWITVSKKTQSESKAKVSAMMFSFIV